jgi:phosphoribosylformylglycinamidine cyclo-ligase
MTVGSKGDARRVAYELAGVDVAAGDRTVELITAAVESTRRPEVLGGLGGFGGAMALPNGYRDPVLVASTDGVGTKTAIAASAGRYHGVGVDLVAMTADDVVCAGAEPLFLLDYVAVGRLDPDVVTEIVQGVASGCRDAGCALIGGETAEHPGTMAPDAFDLSATCVGIVERDDLLDGSAARAGDAIVGLFSSGLHSNGFSLVRQLLADYDIPPDRPYQEQLRRSLGETLADEAIMAEPEHALATIAEVLLTPTRIYAKAVLAARSAVQLVGSDIHGIAHVTGGGLPGNVSRAVGQDLGARLHPPRWRMPSVMRLFGALGGIDDDELRAIFNGGLGMVLVLPEAGVRAAVESLAQGGIPAAVVGEALGVDELDGQRYAEAK